MCSVAIAKNNQNLYKVTPRRGATLQVLGYKSSSQPQHLQSHCSGGIRIREKGVRHSGHLPVNIGCQPHSASIAGS